MWNKFRLKCACWLKNLRNYPFNIWVCLVALFFIPCIYQAFTLRHHIFKIQAWEGTGKRSFKWSTSGAHRPTCKDSNARFTKVPLKPYHIKNVEHKSFFWKVFISLNFSIVYTTLFCRGSANEQFKKTKHVYLMHTWQNKVFKGTELNRTLPSLHGGSLKITLTFH